MDLLVAHPLAGILITGLQQHGQYVTMIFAFGARGCDDSGHDPPESEGGLVEPPVGGNGQSLYQCGREGPDDYVLGQDRHRPLGLCDRLPTQLGREKGPSDDGERQILHTFVHRYDVTRPP